jgi:acyl-CoA oxidase
MSLHELRESTTRKLFRFAELLQGRSDEFKAELARALAGDDRSTGIRFFVQYTLWCGTIENQGSEEQRRLWVDDALAHNYKIIGCFCMTELGHSSHLRGAETTATFDVERDAFVINSPTITATKWW